MHVKRLELHNFMRHESTVLDFPESGIVLVTGPNGAGKSTIPEAVSVAFWDDTLRSTPGWVTGKESSVRCDTDLVVAIRTKSKGGRNGLTWFCPEDDGVKKFENATKAQVELLPIVGHWDTWRRCSVFSSHDAQGFTLATDGERKRLLESILNLDRFDSALARCRSDSKAADQVLRDIETRHARLSGEWSTRVKTLEELRQDLDRSAATLGSVDTDALRERRAKLLKAVASVRTEIEELRGTQREADRKLEAQRAEKAEAERRAGRLAHDKCPTCGQQIPKDMTAALRAEVAKHEEACAEAERVSKKVAEEHASQLAELREERESAERASSDIDAKLAVAKSQAHEARDRGEAMARAEKEVARLEAEVRELKGKVLETSTRSELLEAADGVLGLRGVRTHVLGRALSGIETVAQSWLSRIAGRELRIRLKPYSDKGVKEAISLEVDGLGHEYGYKGSSGGERRRLDVAIMLALGEVAAAARGYNPGTLFCDEVFDALDEDGRQGVIAMLGDLATERAVVVITHSKPLAAELETMAKLRLSVSEGQITVR